MIRQRPRRLRSWLCLVAAFVVAGASLPLARSPLTGNAAAPVRAAQAESCATAWTQHSSPASWNGVQLTGVAALGGQPAWAVGFHTWNSTPDVGIARWSGTQWQGVPSPWGGGGVLNAVSAVSPTVAWTVGEGGNLPRVGTWNGTRWRNVNPPPLGGVMSVLTDVAGVSRKAAWMAGARLVGGRLKPVVLRRKRTSWAVLSPAVPRTTEAGLTAILRAPGGRIWIGGWRGDAGVQHRPWLMYRSGSSWQPVAIDGVPGGRAALTSLAFRSASDGWLAGYVETAGGGYAPILQHWDGATWTNQPTPWTADDSVLLHGVAVDGQGLVTVVGTRLRDSQRSAVVANFDGTDWLPVALGPDAEPPTEGWMMNAAGLDRGSLAVGMHDVAGAAVLTCEEVAAAPSARSGGSSWKRRLTSLGSHAHEDERESGHPTPGAAPPDSPALPTARLPGYEARDVTTQAGLAMTTRTWGAVPADFNADGFVDIFLNRHTETEPELWLGSASGTFAKSAAAFSFEDRHDCEAADVDGDAALDLFCTVGANAGNSTWPHELLIGPLDDNGPLDDGGTDATARFGVLDAFGRGREAVFLNLDGDEYPDLFVTDEPERSDGMPSTNRLYRNVGGTHFVPAPEWGLDSSVSGVCATAADIDGDNDDDLILCQRFGTRKLAAGIRLYLNEGTHFVDRTSALGLVPRGEVDVEIVDLNGDGRLDIASLRQRALRIHRQQPSGAFSLAMSLKVSNNVAMAVGDVNADNRADIFVARYDAADLMLINDGSGAGYASMGIPQPSGSTDDVVALDHDGNGLTDFLSLNGRGPFAGPLMLIGFYETTAE